MTDLNSWRITAIKNLDGFIARLNTLTPDQWQAQTPDEGWEVRHLAAHLVGTTAYVTGMLCKIVAPDGEAGNPQPVEVTPDSPTRDIISNLQVARDRQAEALAQLTEDDLPKLADNPNPYFTPNGELYLTMATFESGIHRYDLEAALNPASATLDTDTVASIDSMFGGNLPTLATMGQVTPDAPLVYRFSGSNVQRVLSWNGEAWIGEPVDNAPIATIAGSDEALVLFMCGRIPVSDPGLRIEGDRDLAGQFKSYVPGP